MAAWFCGNVAVAVAVTITGSHCPITTQNPTIRVDKGKTEMQIEDVRACVHTCVRVCVRFDVLRFSIITPARLAGRNTLTSQSSSRWE